MRKILFVLILLGGFYRIGFSYGRSGNLADPSFLNAGDTAIGLSVTISSTSATQVYSITTTSVVDREILIQNTDNDFEVFCGTHSSVSASSGNRFFLPVNGSFTSNGTYNIWCIGAAGAGSIEMLGVIEYDSKD